MRTVKTLISACLFLVVAACAGTPAPPVSVNDVDFANQRRSLVNLLQRSGPMSFPVIPGDPVLKRAMMEPWHPTTFTGNPQACVVAVYETPRGEDFASVLVEKNDTKIKLSWTAGRGQYPACRPHNEALRPFPELEQDLRRIQRKQASYCERLGGGAATLGSLSKCRYDGLKGFASDR